MSAYSVLSRSTCVTAPNRLLLARCCLDLKKYSEAEETLLSPFSEKAKNSTSSSAVSEEELSRFYGESSSFVWQMLAMISAKTERQKRASEYYVRSLKLNPFLWTSFESLVHMGFDVDSDKVFNLSGVDFNMCHGSNPLVTLWNNGTSPSATASALLSSSTKENNSSGPMTQTNLKSENYEINSPFAVIKNNSSEPGAIDVYTPDSICGWFPTGPFAPQKQLAAHRTLKTLGQNDLRTETPLGTRLSFGVLPLSESKPTIATLLSTPLDQLNESRIGLGVIGSPGNKNKAYNASRAPQKRVGNRKKEQSVPATRIETTREFRNPRSQSIFGQSGNINTDQTPGSNPPVPVRRSSRLYNSCSTNSLNSLKENSKGVSRTNTGPVYMQEINKNPVRTPAKKQKRGSTSSTSTPIQDKDSSRMNELNKQDSTAKSQAALSEELLLAGLKIQRASAEGLMSLLRIMGKALSHLAKYQSRMAIEVLLSLPSRHVNSGWVLSCLGRSHFELAQYNEAAKYYEEARIKAPHRLQGVEFYSTALWHLQQEVKLSMLSQELIEFDKNAPQTWCVAGNCFSLQKEHETAIRFLQRAIQVDPDFAYAYTLLGHELVLTEEMDHALSCFRSAIRIDPRHYNAWYGIGMICYKQEKYPLAEIHYRKALEVSPDSPVLRCHLGVVLHALKKTDAALETLDKAIEMDPQNALCKFHRASFYCAVEKHQEALQELETLKSLVPKESLVYFLIGKVCVV